MNKTLIRNWNERVKEEDIVFHVGDFCFRNSPGGKVGEGANFKASDYAAQLNGKIIFIKGNHDRNNSMKTIIERLVIGYGKMRINLVHMPEMADVNYDINFVGHVHSNWAFKLKGDYIFDNDDHIMILDSDLVNVGIDVNKFMPVSFEELIKKLNRYKKVNSK